MDQIYKSKKKSRLYWKLVFLFPVLLYSMDEAKATTSGENAYSSAAVFAQAPVRGKVVDQDGNPVSGATVTEKGTTNATTTDGVGQFTLNVSNTNATLVVSSIGYQTAELRASGGNLEVTLQADDSEIEEVVIVGFGTQRKKDLTGAVDQVGAEAINNRPVANLGQALQGLIPNLNVGFGNGSPEAEASFNVRGTTSLQLNSAGTNYEASSGSPLILIDGVPGDINRINPEDVESVTVLKDAASAAIYGARAAFGVMLVTTKSGKAGRSQVDYSSTFQWSSPTAIPNIMDAYTLQEAVVNASLNRGLTASSDALLKLDKIKEYMDDPNNVLPYFMNGNNIVWVGNVNPYQEALAKSAPMQKHNLSISGGNEKTTFYGSVGYQNQDGIYKINTDNMKRYNANLNVSSQINNWFKMDFRTSYTNSTYIEPHAPAGKGGWWVPMSQEPGRNVNMPIKTPASSPVGEMYTDNILSFMEYGATDTDRKGNLVMTASPRITLLPGWNFQGDFSYKNYNQRYKEFVPLLRRVENSWTSTTTVHTNPSYVYKSSTESNQYTINIFTDYAKRFEGGHNLTGLLGFNQEWYTDDYMTARRNDINENIPVLGQAAGVQEVGDGESHWAVRGVFYRLTYDYKGKYLLQSNGRYDGTSRFGTDRRFAFFPSVSAGWVVTEESFAEPIKPYVNFLKLRGSYGSLGNQSVPNYAYLLYYNTNSQLRYLFDGTRPIYITPPGLVDANLTWETAATIDFGVDMKLFNHWDVSFDWFDRTTTNILVPGEQYPITLGTGSPRTNAGTLKTKGWELSTSYRNNTSYGLGYDIRFTLNDSRSRVTKFNSNQEKLLSYMYEGMNIGEIWGYETVGLFQSQEEIDNSPAQNKISSGVWYPGDVRYADLNNDGEVSTGANTLADPGDRKVIGNSTPRYQYGFTTNLRYKGFDVNIFLQGTAKRDLWIGNNLFWGAGATGTYEVYNDSWTPENTGAHYPLYVSDGKNRNVQTRYLQSGAYLRLKNISLGYTIPTAVTESIKFKTLRFYASAFNLFEFKSVPKTFDPELTSMNYPILRSYAFGIQATF